MYELTSQFAALRTNQAETNRFFGTLAGTVSIPEFFAPEHMKQIVAGASAAGAAPLGPDLSL